MDIRILGAHNCESTTTGCVCFLIDGTLAIDAGALTSNLSIDEQQELNAILLTHQHYDHIRDIPGIALNCSLRGKSINIYAQADVQAIIEDHLLNGSIYPRFQELPSDRPTVTFNVITPCRRNSINGHQIMAVPVHHFGNTVGYEVGDGTGKTFFYTADTGPGLADAWRQVSPQLLIIDVTVPSEYEAFARKTGHLTPALLKRELVSFRETRGYLPQVLAVHMDSSLEPKIREELAAVGERLGISITLAHEGMQLRI
ncbi:MAG TPA: MBL fold metallo-hydrolase [Dehalococcoidales bacterium]|nr:MAG: hypothetical protein A2Z05_03320 [Chloroflexi bacterium RBG_16_60_22]HJX13928.1 MBL fold metallo-hydrolase [Dehalococcoidales bacterium]